MGQPQPPQRAGQRVVVRGAGAEQGHVGAPLLYQPLQRLRVVRAQGARYGLGASGQTPGQRCHLGLADLVGAVPLAAGVEDADLAAVHQGPAGHARGGEQARGLAAHRAAADEQHVLVGQGRGAAGRSGARWI